MELSYARRDGAARRLYNVQHEHLFLRCTENTVHGLRYTVNSVQYCSVFAVVAPCTDQRMLQRQQRNPMLSVSRAESGQAKGEIIVGI